MRVIWVAAVLAAGCSVDQLPPEDPTSASARVACTTLEGMTFRAPDGTISFRSHDATRSAFTWSRAGGQTTGLVSCNGDALVSDALYEGHFDEPSMELLWEGGAYILAP
jgi:hypothetical protein